MYDAKPLQIIENRKKVSTTQKAKGKQKKKVQHSSIGNSGKSRKHNKDMQTPGTDFGMQMIADSFGDGWYKLITIVLMNNKLRHYLEML